MSPVSYRLLKRTDHEQVAELHRKYLGVERDEAFFEWKYWSCPGGPQKCVLAIDDETGRVVGELGSICVDMRYFGTTAPVYFDVDVMIAERPDRGRIFFRIYRKRLEFIAATEGLTVPLNCSFTIPKTLKITSKLWSIRPVGQAPKTVRVLKHARIVEEKTGSRLAGFAGGLVLDAWSRIRHPTIAPRGIRVDEAASFDAGADRLWDTIKDYHNIWTVRDAAYLNWRYVDIPHVENLIFTVREGNDLLGYLVFNFQDPDRRAGVIQDFQYLGERKDVGRALLSRALRYLAGQGSAVAITWAFAHSYSFPVLREFGFRPRETTGRSLALRHAFEIREPASPSITFDEARQVSNWHLSKGDADDD